MHKFDAYQKFVESTTSDMSKNTLGLASRVLKLEGNTSTTHNSDGSVSRTADINMATLLTSVIGMMAEAGEFAEVVKKKVFQADTQFTDDEVFHMKRELGDVLWYCASLATDLNLTLGMIAAQNEKKLSDRQKAGTLGGSGDTR